MASGVLVRPAPRAARPRSRSARTAATGGRARAGAARRAADRAVAMVLISTAALVLLGLVMVLSASSVSAYARYGSSFLFFLRQVVYAVLGTAVFLVVARIGPGAWAWLCLPVLAGSVLLLGLVLHPSVGSTAGGSARWIALGPVTVQPSEFAKFGTVTFAAALLAKRWQTLGELRRLAFPLVPVVGIVCALILLQPDLGTAMIVIGSVFVVLFAAGARLRHLVGALAGTGVLGLLLSSIEGYRWTRLTSFLDPWADPQGSGYQTIQSLIALASGGPFGVGLGAGRQKWLTLPNAHTDFIFAIIGEELGLVGAIAVLVLFGVLVYGGIRIALRAPDALGRLLAAGMTGWLGIQALVNLGAVTGLLPITGVPLPFVSFGGSSLVVSMAAVGVLVSVARARR